MMHIATNVNRKGLLILILTTILLPWNWGQGKYSLSAILG